MVGFIGVVLLCLSLALCSLFSAVSVNHDDRGGTALDALVWEQEAFLRGVALMVALILILHQILVFQSSSGNLGAGLWWWCLWI